jgi:shikimate 5-dehydrogenase
MPDLALPVPDTSTFYFIGVTTSQSSSRHMFPRWMQALNRPEVEWRGVDLPLHADPQSYRQVVQHIKQEPLALGALVTTHKLDLLAAARDLFDEIGPYATQTNEVSSIAKDGGKLIGQATDPVAGGLSLDAILGADYFARTGGEVLMLGAGGAAVALSLHLLQKPNPDDRPQRIVAVDLSPHRLAHLRELAPQFNTDTQFDTIENDKPQGNDELMATLPPGSGQRQGRVAHHRCWPISAKRSGLGTELSGKARFLPSSQSTTINPQSHSGRRLGLLCSWLVASHGPRSTS